MSALKEEALLNGAGGLKTDSLKSILTNTINTIEDNKSQIFDIYETARAEVESSKQQLQELKKQAQQTIDRVDDLVKQEQREKQQLVQVSSNFQDYSEEKIRECYEQVKNVQVELGVQREKEQNLRQQRDRLELRLRHLQVMLVSRICASSATAWSCACATCRSCSCRPSIWRWPLAQCFRI